MKIIIKYFIPFWLLLVTVSLWGCEDDLGRTHLPISYFTKIDYEPAWSPDGEWIVYIHNVHGVIDGPNESDPPGIYLIRPDGTDKTLWMEGFGLNSPDWSPDGEWIIYGKRGHIYKRTVAGDSLMQLTTEGNNFYPTWSPDGEWIAFHSNRLERSTIHYIWIMDQHGENKKLIVQENKTGTTRTPSWTADNRIYHTRAVPDAEGREIFSMDMEGNYEDRLTNDEFQDAYPNYSPEAGLITYTSVQEESKPPLESTVPSIWVMQKDGSNQVKLTDEERIWGDYSRWSPDGKQVVFTNKFYRNGRLWIMDKDGSNKRQLTP